MLTPEEITQHMAAGWTYEQLVQHGKIAPQPAAGQPPAPPAAPPGVASASALASALGDAKRGNAQGRPLPEGYHVVEVKRGFHTMTNYGEAYIVEFIARESQAPETAIGEEYSCSFIRNDRFPNYFVSETKDFVAACAESDGRDPQAWDPNWLAEYSESVLGANGAQMPGQNKAAGKLFKVFRRDKETNGGNVKKICEQWTPAQLGELGAAVPPAPPAAAAPPPPGAPQPPPPPGVAPMAGMPTPPPPPPGAGTPAPPAAPPSGESQPPPGWPAGVPWAGAQ